MSSRLGLGARSRTRTTTCRDASPGGIYHSPTLPIRRQLVESAHKSVRQGRHAAAMLTQLSHCAGTAIPPWKRRIPFDLRSKARSGPVSTEVGDDSGILRCRSFCSAQLCWLPVLRLCTPSLT